MGRADFLLYNVGWEGIEMEVRNYFGDYPCIDNEVMVIF